ncbi:MAG: hypothetical protein HRU19_30575 [Pseudobacteriovorax sp.]|nr:hypothetical protein [Pseudobacteriovorax sp.]
MKPVIAYLLFATTSVCLANELDETNESTEPSILAESISEDEWLDSDVETTIEDEDADDIVPEPSQIEEDYRLPLSPEGNLDRVEIVGEVFNGQVVQGNRCYHSVFENVEFTYGIWGFSQVSRFCNFSQSDLDHTVFQGWLYNMTFEDSSLMGAIFILDPRSRVTFINTDLTGASIYTNGATVEFIDVDQGVIDILD